jgi:hypothetical protein
MIRLGLRLTLSGGREAAARLIMIVAAVALGVGMLLTTLAGINAVNTQNGRYAWLETDAAGVARAHLPRAGVDPLWWKLTADEFAGKIVGRVDVAATGRNSPVPPGMAALPGPGEYLASPALAKLLRSTAADELAERYPGRMAGTLGAAALPSPNSLIAVVGHIPAEMSQVPGATEVTRISTTTPSSCSGASCYYIGFNADDIDLILSIVVAALLFPILIFIGTATRLSAARREQRFAALRLVGATPRQIAVISAVESTLAAGAGVLAGFGLFFAMRPAVVMIPFTGDRFFLSDLSLTWADVLAVAAGVPIAAAAIARLALRRVAISPLGVTRRVTPRAPRAWRLVPLLAGLAELGWFALAGRPQSTAGQVQAFLSGILVTMIGLVVAGPWFTMIGSRLLARRASTPASLIAARRLADDPHAGFRAISGLALALFATSCAVGTITTINAHEGGGAVSAADRATLVEQFTSFRPAAARVTTSVAATPTGLLTRIRALDGVRGITLIRLNPATAALEVGRPDTGLVACADVARTPALGRCPATATTATIDPNLLASRWAESVLPASSKPASALAAMPVAAIAVATDGSTRTIERARTVLARAHPYGDGAVTIAERRAQSPNTQRDVMYQRLADVVIIASLVIAGATLAVSTVGGLNDRRRPFGLLRLAGARLATLQRVVTLESAAPLLATAVIACGAGFLASFLFLRAQLSYALQAPDPMYYVIVGAGMVASLALIASTLPLLRRLTAPEAVRDE